MSRELVNSDRSKRPRGLSTPGPAADRSAVGWAAPVLADILFTPKAATLVASDVDHVFAEAAHLRPPFGPHGLGAGRVSLTDSRGAALACCGVMYWPLTALRCDTMVAFFLVLILRIPFWK